MPGHTLRSFAFGFAFMGLVSACTNIDFKEPVSDFSVAMSKSAAILNDYYGGLNAKERKVYLTQAAYTDNMEIGKREADGTPTGLTYFYPPEWIKAKTDTINLLSVYGARLAALAGSTAPEQYSSGVKVLGNNINTLDAQVRAISKSPGQLKFAADISTIFSVVAEMYADHKRDVAIRDAVTKGHDAVISALDFLQSDLPDIKSLETSGKQQSLDLQISYYNKEFGEQKLQKGQKPQKASLSQKASVLKEIADSAQVLELTSSQDPSIVIDAIRDAMNAIVAYAKDPGGPDKLVRLNSAIETFNNRVGPIATSISNMNR
jgi:hypothetical protein